MVKKKLRGYFDGYYWDIIAYKYGCQQGSWAGNILLLHFLTSKIFFIFIPHFIFILADLHSSHENPSILKKYQIYIILSQTNRRRKIQFIQKINKKLKTLMWMLWQ
jgi:hypothetical protein